MFEWLFIFSVAFSFGFFLYFNVWQRNPSIVNTRRVVLNVLIVLLILITLIASGLLCHMGGLLGDFSSNLGSLDEFMFFKRDLEGFSIRQSYYITYFLEGSSRYASFVRVSLISLRNLIISCLISFLFRRVLFFIILVAWQCLRFLVYILSFIPLLGSFLVIIFNYITRFIFFENEVFKGVPAVLVDQFYEFFIILFFIIIVFYKTTKDIFLFLCYFAFINKLTVLTLLLCCFHFLFYWAVLLLFIYVVLTIYEFFA